MISFISLKTIKIANLKGLSTNIIVQDYPGTIYINYSFSMHGPMSSSLFAYQIFLLLLKTVHFDYYNVATMEIRNIPFPGFIVATCYSRCFCLMTFLK